ncbi:hypothetical protein pdam_00013435 [Pocillopora damicornis]|uniref:Uncharacterized protein n=1 Tax=Pocillopora damicornis TaxID=46731 RepID=A0A3M6UWH2_POCDA|nr:hypothetical protein pdam_00013435 [Pocillopora damicornis]
MAVTMEIVLLAGLHVKQAFNRPRRALGVIEGEIPTATAKVTWTWREVSVKFFIIELAVLCKGNDCRG